MERQDISPAAVYHMLQKSQPTSASPILEILLLFTLLYGLQLCNTKLGYIE